MMDDTMNFFENITKMMKEIEGYKEQNKTLSKQLSFERKKNIGLLDAAKNVTNNLDAFIRIAEDFGDKCEYLQEKFEDFEKQICAEMEKESTEEEG